MGSKQLRVRRAMRWHRRSAIALTALGFTMASVGLFLGLGTPYGIALAAMGALLLGATVPLSARAATLRRQLTQIELSRASQCDLRPQLLPAASFYAPGLLP